MDNAATSFTRNRNSPPPKNSLRNFPIQFIDVQHPKNADKQQPPPHHPVAQCFMHTRE
jgi:hypothetical protein